MKKSGSLFILILFSVFNQCSVKEVTFQPIERTVGKMHISIDPRMEILSTVQLLSDYPIIRRDLSYSKDIILNYFESFALHEAVIMTDSLSKKYGFAYDGPIIFMLHLSQFPELERKIAFTDYLKGRSGGGDNLEQYRKAIKQFASASNFETFWSNTLPFYNQILDLTIANIGEMDFVKILEDYFNETNDDYNMIISPSIGGGYGPKITDDDGKETFYVCLTITDIKDNIPYLHGNIMISFIFHEFGHSFVNPVTEKYSDKVETLNKLFEPIKETMSRQAYGEWKICVYEHIVRAVVVRLFELNFGFQESKPLLDNELSRGFIYIEPLIEKLKEFEIQRDKNNITFSEFYPELLNALESLLP